TWSFSIQGQNTVYEVLDFQTVFLELESKSRQIELCCRGVFLSQQLPRGFRCQIELARLVISISQASQAAQQVSEIHHRGHFRNRAIRRWPVMKFNHAAEVQRELPKVRQHASALAVSKAQHSLLDFTQGSL